MFILLYYSTVIYDHPLSTIFFHSSINPSVYILAAFSNRLKNCRILVSGFEHQSELLCSSHLQRQAAFCEVRRLSFYAATLIHHAAAL